MKLKLKKIRTLKISIWRRIRKKKKSLSLFHSSVFPIFMQIFSSLFASNDLQNVFATKAMFIFCIYTAVIWTIPLFCFYFNQPNSKKVVYICILLELVRILVYSKTLYSYYIQNIYPVRVFIFFILADLIRYIFLLISIKPILTNNVSD